MVEYAYKENGVLKLKPVAMSLSQAQIDEITTELLEAMQPDWQNAISLTAARLKAGYAAPADGIVTGYGYTNTRGTFVVRINDVATGGYWYNDAFSFLNIQCPINKGDTIKTENQLESCDIYFVPFKTSNPVSLRPIDKTKIDAAIVQHWDDITSDFSIPGSTSGLVLQSVKYNAVLQQLKLYLKKTSSVASGTTARLFLQYNGSELISFGDNTIAFMNHVGQANGTLAGMEYGTAVVASNKIQIDMYNRNGNNAWAANDTYRGVIWL